MSPGLTRHRAYADGHEEQVRSIQNERARDERYFPRPPEVPYDGARGVPGDHPTATPHVPNVSVHREKNQPVGGDTTAPGLETWVKNLRSGRE